jgi:hypothetical protein
MANRGTNELSVQEAVNFRCFNDFNYEELDLNDSSTSFSATCDTNSNTTVTCVGNANIKVGMQVAGTGIPLLAYITAVNATLVSSFTISEAAGSTAEITVLFAGGEDTETSSYITADNPAKKVVIYEKPGGASSNLQDIDTLTITYNGSKTIKIDSTDLPFTLTGQLITSLSVAVDQANITDAVSVLSFH